MEREPRPSLLYSSCYFIGRKCNKGTFILRVRAHVSSSECLSTCMRTTVSRTILPNLSITVPNKILIISYSFILCSLSSTLFFQLFCRVPLASHKVPGVHAGGCTYGAGLTSRWFRLITRHLWSRPTAPGRCQHPEAEQKIDLGICVLRRHWEKRCPWLRLVCPILC